MVEPITVASTRIQLPTLSPLMWPFRQMTQGERKVKEAVGKSEPRLPTLPNSNKCNVIRHDSFLGCISRPIACVAVRCKSEEWSCNDETKSPGAGSLGLAWHPLIR